MNHSQLPCRGLEGALASAHMEATDLDRQLRESQAEQGRLVAALAALHSRVATPGAAGALVHPGS